MMILLQMKSITIFFLLLVHVTCFGKANTKAILDSVFSRARETSMYSATVNWDSLQKQVYARAEQASTIQDLKPAFETLLNGLRDHHGKIISAKDYSYIAWFSDQKTKTKNLTALR